LPFSKLGRNENTRSNQQSLRFFKGNYDEINRLLTNTDWNLELRTDLPIKYQVHITSLVRIKSNKFGWLSPLYLVACFTCWYRYVSLTDSKNFDARCSGPTLDLILTNEEEMIDNVVHNAPLGNSDHEILNNHYASSKETTTR
jgi:hypothetical protein